MRRHVAAVVLAAYLPFALGGCVSIKLEQRLDAAAEPPGRAAFRFLAVRKASQRGTPEAAVPVVVAALYRIVKSEEAVVWRGTEGDWAVRDLPAGNYRLRVERVGDEDGLKEPRGDVERDFSLRPGEAAQANVVLEKKPVGLIVALSVTVVLLAVVLVVLAQGGDLPSPPDLGDLAGVMPIPPLSPDAVGLGLEFITLVEGDVPAPSADEDRPAHVVAHGPADGSRHVAPATPIDLELDVAVDPLTIDQRTLGLFAGHRQIPAAIAIRKGGRLLHAEPLEPLPAAAEVTVRFLGEHVAQAAQDDGDAEAPKLGQNYEWAFTVASGE